jgi:beta-ureidopropionase / N-carbamoyl-L-amino-acid hydrolase
MSTGAATSVGAGAGSAPRALGPVLAGFERRWAELAPVGRQARHGGYRRYAWTREAHTLREWFTGQCQVLGLDLATDRVANLWAWWGDPDAAVASGDPGVVVGSHLDSVPDGGAFDGPLGVVSALGAVELLQQQGFRPSRPIAVVCFEDEEGARFGVPCAGSRLLTGQLSADRARALTDADGVSMAQAMRSAGRDPEQLAADPQALARVGAFVELHVEQGRALALPEYAAPVAVGTDIWPHGRWRVDLTGEANHAGTTALADRRDALLALARLVTAARDGAQRHGCVATVGKVAVEPNAVNAVPSAVTAWVDARGSDESAVHALVADLTALAGELDGEVSNESWTPTTRFDADLSHRVSLAAAAELAAAGVTGSGHFGNSVTEGAVLPHLGTGAGHDAGILAMAGIATAMLFVRNPTGISHSPAEFAEPGDCAAGIVALAGALRHLADRRPAERSSTSP